MNNNDKEFFDSVWENDSQKEASSSIEEIDANEDVKNNNTGYMCNSCRTIFTTNSIDNCPICGGKSFVSSNSSLQNNILYIPFNIDLEEAKKEYKKYIRFKFFIPFMFRKKRVYENLKKVYVPVSLYNCKASGDVIYYSADENVINKKHEIKKYECEYETNFDYNNVLVSECSKINEEIFSDIFDYDYSGTSLYQDSILGDGVIINGDIDSNDLETKLNGKVMKQSLLLVKDEISHHLKKLKENKLTMSITSNNKVLVPIFLLTVKYKDKNNYYLMNGQNKKIIFSSELSKVNIALFGLIIFALVFIFAYLLSCII